MGLLSRSPERHFRNCKLCYSIKEKEQVPVKRQVIKVFSLNGLWKIKLIKTVTKVS